MSAPLVVNTRDGVCWTRRTVTSSGIALYAPEGVCGCPEFVMATLPELAEHGITGTADVLPMPVGPQPQAPRPIAYAAKNTDLLLADAAERSRAAEWPWDMWCRICHIRPTSHRTEAEALEAADRHVKLQHASQAEVHKLMAAGGLSELETLRARVAELEAERHETNEALDDAVQELRARQSCPCPPVDQPGPHQLGCPLAEVPRPSVEESADRLTAFFAPVAALREVSSREEPHDSPLHQEHRIPHDLPDGCRLTAEQLDEVSRRFHGGGGA